MDAVTQARAIAMAASESAVDGRAAYLLTVETLLFTLIGAEFVIWNGIDTGTSEFLLAGSASDDWRWLLPTLAATLNENPLAKRFLTTPTLCRPIRMSDLIDSRALRAGRLYNELWRPMGARYQVGLPTVGSGSGASRGWAINREASDFDDAQVDALSALQPALVMLEDIVQVSGPSEQVETAAQGSAQQVAIERYGLTAREAEVLGLVAQGWTARHIAHYLRISVGTIRKHLEHAYAKLGTHDRLSAVIMAGLSPTAPPLDDTPELGER